jgi:hypothetical protein
MHIRRFGKIRRFNKQIQIWCYHLKQNKLQVAVSAGFILFCLHGGNPKSGKPVPPSNTGLEYTPTWRSYVISFVVGQIIFYLIGCYAGYHPQVPQVEVKKRFVVF